MRSSVVSVGLICLVLAGCARRESGGNLLPTGVLVKPSQITASKQSGAHFATRAFDGSTAPDDFWEEGGPFPVALDAAFAEATAIREYELACGESGERMPKAWKLSGSNDNGATWSTLDSRSETAPWTPFSKRLYTIAKSAPFRLYRLEFTATFSPEDILRIYEMSFFR